MLRIVVSSSILNNLNTHSKNPNVMKNICCITSMLCLSAWLTAQTAIAIAEKFIDYSLLTDTLNIKARLFIPEAYSDQEKYPVVITLHGIGECGDDNIKHIFYNNLATTWGTDYFQSEHPCFIFSPQCPTGQNWTTTDVYLSVMELLDSLKRSYSIDEDRLYLTGLSLGGIGTWNYLKIEPELYAAAVPVCGGLYVGNDAISEHVNIIKHIPVWNFHGNLDNTVATDLSRSILKNYPQYMDFPLYTHNYCRVEYSLEEDVIDDYIAKHAELIYSEIPDVGHNVWNYAYLYPQMKEWLFRQRKHATDNVIVADQGDVIKVSGTHEFTFTTSELADSISIWTGHVNSPDWEYVEMIDASLGAYTFDSQILSDHPRSLLKFIAHDTSGNAIGKDYSDILCIDNEGNGPPYIELVDDLFLKNTSISVTQHKVAVLVADPESDPLHVYFDISYDNGRNFEAYDDADLDEGIYEQIFNFDRLYESDSMVIRAEVSDGEQTAMAQTLYFENISGIGVSSASLKVYEFEIYPNPVLDQIIIKSRFSGPRAIEISNISGQVVFICELESNCHQIDLSQLEEGGYFITIRSEDFVTTRKIIKL